MSYKIAVASSDGGWIDESFGAAGSFHIYQVEDSTWEKIEERKVIRKEVTSSPVQGGGCSQNGCGNGGGCSGKERKGCGSEVSPKVELILDCRCIVCTKIGFPIQKQLERKAIAAFDVNCSVEEALSKISHYYSRIDNHESLRGSKQIERQLSD